MDVLEDLQQWYFDGCDGDWEHTSGIELVSTDSLGWEFYIDLWDSDLADLEVLETYGEPSLTEPKDDWYRIWTEKKQLRGNSSSGALHRALERGLQLVEFEPTFGQEADANPSDLLHQLLAWRISQSKPDFSPTVKFVTMDNPGWDLSISLEHTSAEKLTYKEEFEGPRRHLYDLPVNGYDDQFEWYRIWTRRNCYRAFCSPKKLSYVLAKFFDLVEGEHKT